MNQMTAKSVIGQKPGRSNAVSKRVFEQVCDRIRDDLRTGALVAGDKLLSERDLAEQFGVSRTAVREALRTLEMSGVLEFTKGVNGGAVIRQGSTHGVKQSIKDMVLLGSIPLSHLTEVRTCLLGFAVRLAAERGSELDFEALAANIDLTEELVQHEDPLDAISAISEFYMLLARAAHNKIMDMMVESLTEIVRDLLLAVRLRPTIDIISPRRRTLAFLLSGNGEAAEIEMRDHLLELTQFIIENTELRD